MLTQHPLTQSSDSEVDMIPAELLLLTALNVSQMQMITLSININKV